MLTLAKKARNQTLNFPEIHGVVWDGPKVVATAHTSAGLKEASSLKKGGPVDFIEIRADALPVPEEGWAARIGKLPLPVIFTVRSTHEGGVKLIASEERVAMYRSVLGVAAMIDFELQSLAHLGGIKTEALANNTAVILSMHNFRSGSPLSQLVYRCRRAERAGASIFKVAMQTNYAHELSALLGLLDRARTVPVSAMGMGVLGRASRPVLGLAGSILNYGYLDEPAAPGQWPAQELPGAMKLLST